MQSTEKEPTEKTEKATETKMNNAIFHNTDEDIIKMEHNLKNVQEIELKQLIGDRKKIKNEYIYYNLFQHMGEKDSVTDTSKLDYNKYGKRGFRLTKVTDIFSDNILLACLVPEPLIKKSK